MSGGGEGAEAAITSLTPYLLGHDPFALEALRWKIANPTATLYNNRLQLLAALEFACLDIMGKALDLPVHALLGGKLRDAVPFASYIFFRYADSERLGEVRATDQLLAHARALKQQYGFTAHKLTGGVFPPAYELACYRALADALPGDRLRYDPNCALSLEEAIPFGKGIRHHRAFDVVLLDTTFWGGIRACIKAAGVSETFQLGVAVHSSGELGIQLATMLHRGAVLPNLTYAAD